MSGLRGRNVLQRRLQMRNHYNAEELQAALLLDYARAGGDVPIDVINRALVVLGDGVGL